MTIDPSDPVARVASALSLTSLRNSVIANNIANRDTEGYRRLALRFDDAMSIASTPTVRNESAVRVVPEGTSDRASLEQDMVALSTNALQYQALTRALGRYFSLLSTITSNTRS